MDGYACVCVCICLLRQWRVDHTYVAVVYGRTPLLQLHRLTVMHLQTHIYSPIHTFIHIQVYMAYKMHLLLFSCKLPTTAINLSITQPQDSCVEISMLLPRHTYVHRSIYSIYYKRRVSVWATNFQANYSFISHRTAVFACYCCCMCCSKYTITSGYAIKSAHINHYFHGHSTYLHLLPTLHFIAFLVFFFFLV